MKWLLRKMGWIDYRGRWSWSEFRIDVGALVLGAILVMVLLYSKGLIWK